MFFLYLACMDGSINCYFSNWRPFATLDALWIAVDCSDCALALKKTQGPGRHKALRAHKQLLGPIYRTEIRER